MTSALVAMLLGQPHIRQYFREVASVAVATATTAYGRPLTHDDTEALVRMVAPIVVAKLNGTPLPPPRSSLDTSDAAPVANDDLSDICG
ncbi:MAG: hypothetical protein ACK4QW_09990 [Alphaproteobacteria bacterium]